MAYNILGLNFSHNSSACVLSDGNLVCFLEEERLSRIKHDVFPLKLLEYISKNFIIDKIAVSGLQYYPLIPTNKPLLETIINKTFLNHPKVYFLDYHHLTHAASSFYNSKFSNSLSLVIDGSGTEYPGGKFETESAFLFQNNSYKEVYKSYRSNDGKNDLVTLSKVYELVSYFLGFGKMGFNEVNEAGKTMGLSSYGKFNHLIPKLYKKNKGNPDFIKPIKGVMGTLNPKYNFLLKTPELRQDLAYHVQQESQQEVGNLIETLLNHHPVDHICCSGGYFLNCVANYYLIKRFPNIKFHFDPISSDAGTSIGAARLIWHIDKQHPNNTSLNSLYQGPQYSKKQLLKSIKKYVDVL